MGRGRIHSPLSSGCPQHPQLCLRVPIHGGTQPSATIPVSTNLSGVTGGGGGGRGWVTGALWDGGRHQGWGHPTFAHGCEVPPACPPNLSLPVATLGDIPVERWGSTGETEAQVTWGHHKTSEQIHPISYHRTPRASLAAHTWKKKINWGRSMEKGRGAWTPRVGAAGRRSGEGRRRRGGGSCERAVPAVSGERQIIQRHQPERNQPAEPRAKIPAVK